MFVFAPAMAPVGLLPRAFFIVPHAPSFATTFAKYRASMLGAGATEAEIEVPALKRVVAVHRQVVKASTSMAPRRDLAARASA